MHSHAHTHSHSHAHTLTRKHTCTHSHSPTLTSTHTHTDPHSHSHTLTRTHTHTLTRTHTHTHTHSLAHILTRTHTHTHTHTRTHTHTHTHSLAHTLTLTRIHTLTRTHALTRTHTLSRTHTHAHSHSRTRSHTLTRSLALTRSHALTHTHTLTVLPLTEHGFSLHRSAFQDALALRYGWSPSKLPSKCICGKNFTVEHALSCAREAFPSIRHNEIRDLTANLLTEVCNDVRIEPDLQPVLSDQLSGATANSQDGARLDLSANVVWGGSYEKTFFDVRVFNHHAPSNKNLTPPASYRKHEKEGKKRPMSNGCVRWSILHLHPSSSLQQEAWEPKQQVFTNICHPCSPRSGTSHTAAPCAG